MTEVNSQIQFPAALPRAESVKYFEGTVQDMNSSLRIPLRIHAVRETERERAREREKLMYRRRSAATQL